MNGPTADFITSTLSGAIAADATTITIGTGVSIPSTNGALQIDYDSTEAVGEADGPETITYATYNTATGVLGGVTRGAAGTTGVTHQNGASVSCGPTSLYFQIDASWNSIIVGPTKGTGQTLVFAGIDLTGVLAIGDKIKYTDTTVKFGYITAISFSTDTTITITGGSDYTLVADPTSGTFYYSKSSSPVGFPQWFNYTPTYVGFSAAPATIARFNVTGRLVNLNIRAKADGTSNANNFTITPPILAPALADQAYSAQLGVSVNNGSQTTSRDIAYYEPSASQVIQLALNGSTTGWATSNGKRATFQMFYEI
jgi:hypothetical protein